MITEFELLPETSRIFIFQSQKKLTSAHEQLIRENLPDFLQTWHAHGKRLNSAWKIFDRHFLVIAVNEDSQNASGCSIDSLNQFIRVLSEKLSADLFDRSIAFGCQNELSFAELQELKTLIIRGVITPDTPVYNNSVVTKKKFNEEWKLKASKSWMSRYL
ncbi:MAG: hypothetical protein MI784_12900 [Cytophagales bacterium]|nr:hypothetical protein [Cytophagales bacterium]